MDGEDESGAEQEKKQERQDTVSIAVMNNCVHGKEVAEMEIIK